MPKKKKRKNRIPEDVLNAQTKNRFTRLEILISIICGFFLVLFSFPEVVLLNSTFRYNDTLFYNQDASKAVNILPLDPHIQKWHAYYDRAAALAQSEPGMEFLKESIQNGESPYWNPYSASGMVGPETLVDNKFSIVNWIYIILGGGQRVFDCLILASIWLAASCMHYFIRDICELSQISAWAGAAFFILNGFSTANMGTNLTGSYYFIPVCLLSCCKLVKRFSLRGVSISAITIAMVLSFTFMPTTVSSMIGIILILLFYVLSQNNDRNQNIKIFLSLFCAGVLGVFLVTAIYLPIVENLLFDSAELASYASRESIDSPHWSSLLSLFSSSHFFESYAAFREPIYAAYNNLWVGGTFHIGVISAFLIVYGLIFKYQHKLHRSLVWGSFFTAFLFMARVYDLPVYSWFFSKIPVIGKFQAGYLWPGVMLSFALLLAFGLENLAVEKITLVPLAVVLTIWISLCFAVYYIGIQSPAWEFITQQKIHLAIMVLFILVTSLLIIVSCFARTKKRKKAIGLLLLFALLINLRSEFKFVFFPAPDFFNKTESSEVKFIKDNSEYYRAVGFGGQAHVRPEIGSAWGLYDIGSTNMSIMPEYAEFYLANINLGRGQRFSTFLTTTGVSDNPELNTINNFAFDILGVKYLVLPLNYTNYVQYFQNQGYISVAQFTYPDTITPANILENPNVWPRAFWLPAESLITDNNYLLKPEQKDMLKEASIVEYHHNNLHIRGTAEHDGIVVLTDNWHRNWKAEVNGKESEIIKIHNIFRGVVVPKGDFEIKMAYKPSTLDSAFVLTGISVFICCICLFIPKITLAMINRIISKKKLFSFDLISNSMQSEDKNK